MKAAVILLFLGLQCDFVIYVVHGEPQFGTKLSSNQGRPNSQPSFFDFGLDNNPDALGAFWDRFFGLEMEVTMDTMERILFNGYPAEVHTIITEDGHILKIHRIPSKDKSATPVGLVHGTVTQADCWLGNTKENCLHEGFDVWLFNLRGCQNSLGHISKDNSPSSKDYWSFSFDEMAKYDLPACVDYILQKTGQQQLNLVGHSLGGGLPIFMLAERPEYNKKVKGVYALAPLGNMADLKRAFGFMEYYDTIYEILTKGLNLYELYFPLSKRTIGTLVQIFTYLTNSRNANPRTANMLAAGYSSTSCLLVHHYDQFIRANGSAGVVHYDWGENINLAKYGRISPPPYNLSAVVAPVHVYYGGEDHLISETNCRYIRDHVSNCVAYERIDNWDHIAFISSPNTAQLLYKPMAKIMKEN